MPTDDSGLFPPEPLISGARTLVRNGLMQTDMDASFFRILNLDTSNLVIPGIPSQGGQVNQWFNSYDAGSKTFGVAQPGFTNLSGQLTFTQQGNITRLGHIVIGQWNATPIGSNYLPTLDKIASPVANVTFTGQRAVSLGDPINDQDAVTLGFFNARNVGTQPKAAVKCASIENMGLATLDHPVDGVTLNDNDRVLVKDQTGSRVYQNGIWLAHPGAWTRSTDADTSAKLALCTCFVLQGTTNALTTWLEATPLPFNIGPTDPPPYPQFVLFQSGTIVQAGNGLGKIGNTLFAVGTTNRIAVGSGIDIDPNYAGQGSISTLGIVGTGTWQGDVVAGQYGGTGISNPGKHITLAGDFSTQLSFGAPIGSYLAFNLLGATTLTLPVVGTVSTLGGNETFTNKHISAGQIDSGVLLITVGGTSANNAVDAANNLLPNQTGHSGQFLTTDGAGNLSWAKPGP